MVTVNRKVSAVLAAAGVVALLVAAPWALLTWGRVDLLASIDWRRAFSVPDDGRLMLGLLSVLGWFAWLTLSVSVVIETVDAVATVRAARAQRPHRPLSLPGLDLPRLVVRGLVVSAVTAVMGVVVPPAALGTVMPPAHASSPTDTAPLAGTADATSADMTSQGATTVVVARGDSLSRLAARHLGNGDRWPEIFALNRDLVKDANLIYPGWRLRLPGSAAQAPGGVGAAAGTKGPTLAAVPATPQPDDSPSPSSPLASEAAAGTGSGVPSARVAHPSAGDETVAAQGSPITTPDGAAESPRPHPSTGASADQVRPAATEGASTAATGSSGGAQPSDGDGRSLSASQALALGVVGTVGAGFAAGLVRTVRRRRDIQLALRPPGRRIIFPGDPCRIVESALTLVGRSAGPHGSRPEDSTSGPHDRLDVRPHAPDGRSGEHLEPHTTDAAETACGDLSGASDPAPLVQAGRPRHALADTEWARVTAGLTVGGPVDLDLEAHRLVTVDLGDEKTSWGTACAWALELACGSDDAEAPSGAATIVAAGPIGNALSAAELDSIIAIPVTSAAVDHLVKTATRQRQMLIASGWSLEDARLDRDARDAWWPTVYVFGPLDEESTRRVEAALGGDVRTAVTAIFVPGESQRTTRPGLGARLTGSADRAVLEPDGVRLRPVSLTALGAAGALELLRSSGSDETAPAGWYALEDAPDNVLPLLPRHAVPMKEAVDVGDDSPGVTDFSHPTLMLLGPIQLLGAAGPPPARAERSCIEYCAWMVEHPGATASQMAASLLVAEGTRRSNVSRLRGWLGAAEDGTPYLPEAYTGRLNLDSLVSSDWQRMQALVSPGVNRVPVSTLVSALKLVRGAPLADAAPGQWHWAEELRTEMVCMIRDIGARVGDVALAEGDLDLARWAAARALVAAPGDEVLMRLRLRTEHRAGNRPEVERIVLQLTRHARVLGIDLDDETVRVIQEAIEGRARARA